MTFDFGSTFLRENHTSPSINACIISLTYYTRFLVLCCSIVCVFCSLSLKLDLYNFNKE